MKYIFAAFIILIFISCNSEKYNCDLHSEEDHFLTNRYLNRNIEYPHIRLLAPDNFDKIIQYHGHDSWGWFDHTIRITSTNGMHLLQLLESKKSTQRTDKKTTYKEYILSDEQWNSLNEKATSLYCNRSDLELNLHGVDGDYYNLILKDGKSTQLLFWQMINEKEASDEIRELKQEVAALVGDMMEVCSFPHGKKIIVRDNHRNDIDSVEYDIFLTNQYNCWDYEVLFEGQNLPLDRDHVANLKLPLTDTLNLEKRVVVKTRLLNGEIIEL